MTKLEVSPQSDRELVLSFIMDAPAEKLFRAWTDPKLIPLWFVPKPWSIARAEMDVRAGGSSLVVMKSPEGQEFPNPGVYLEVVPNKKIVFTDAFTKAWEPSTNAFMVATVTFEDQGGGKTKYTARAQHWSKESREQHEKMGFAPGWTQVAQQLEDLVKSL
jgi:uncharacterized protein YndB with AHSA1/START domain